MRAARLRHRIQLQQLSEIQDSYGEMVRSYSNYAIVWAEVEPLNGKELEHAQQVFSEVEYKVTIRYKAGVSETDRIEFKGMTFEIGSVINPFERNQYLELMCKVIK